MGQGKCDGAEFVALWQFTISYLRDVKGLHNLIWAYSPDMIHLNSRDAYLEYWPGDEWVDILGLDAYDRNGADYDHKGLQMIRLMKNIAYTKNKPLALTETGLENNNPEESNYYNKKWWTSMLYKIIENEPVSFVLLWLQRRFPDQTAGTISALSAGAIPRRILWISPGRIRSFSRTTCRICISLLSSGPGSKKAPPSLTALLHVTKTRRKDISLRLVFLSCIERIIQTVANIIYQ